MRFAQFFRDRKGGVAPLLAIAIIPLVGAVGAAVDYSRASSTRTAMQAAGDAAALMLAKQASSLTDAQFQQSAFSYFTANFSNHPEAQNLQVSAVYSQGTSGFSVTVTSSATVIPAFLPTMGYGQIALATSGTVSWNNAKLRVALVLDNTGSMAQSGKMTALQTASHNLLTQLKNAAQTDSDVYVSIIPFAKDVNVDPANSGQSWIRWSGSSDTWDENNGTCTKSSYHTQSKCTSNSGTWTPKNHSTWNGCVMDRDQNYDTTNTAPTAGSTLFPAEQYDACPVPVMALSYVWTALNNKIDAMKPNGGTNQAIGLAWGWQSLSNPPLAVPTKDPNYQYQQIIILLTDGLNTQDRWYGDGTNLSAQVDTRQQILCSNIKAASITVYAVQVNTGGDATSTLLQNCASDTSKFFLLTKSDQIVTTFDTIGTSISQLHLSK
jgi:Flp pilus assembly protein TadG